MPGFTKLILAHHGTPGAIRAEELAFSLAEPGLTQMVHLWVVPEFWADMQGDDWLNNASTRDGFGNYVEKLLQDEANAWVERLSARCQGAGLPFRSVIRLGEPTREIVKLASWESAPVVIGPRRKRGMPGLRSHLDLGQLACQLTTPLLMAAHPADGT